MTAAVQAPPRFLRDAVILGLLTALGPFAIDMYLPALPVVGATLGVDADRALGSLTAYFVTFAFGQMIFGTASDIAGRKPPLYAGLLLFLLASIGCALAPDLPTLVALRALQGLGGAAGMVIARAIVRDLHSGAEEMRLLSMLMLVFSVSPILAPLAGSLIIESASWRGVFWLIAVLAALGLLMAWRLVPETRPPSRRATHSLASVTRATGRLLRHRPFMSLTFVGSLAICGFFVFLGHSAFVFTGHYGLSTRQYSLVFGVNAAAFFIGTQFGGRLAERWGLPRLVRRALGAYAALLVLLAALVAAGIEALPVVVGLLFCGYACVGLMLPGASVLALAEHGDAAGTASSLLNTLQLVSGAVLMAVSGLFADGRPLPMVACIAVCACAAWLLATLTLPDASGGDRAARDGPQTIDG